MSFQPVVNALIQIITQIIDFIPRLVNGLIILIVGYLISALIRWIIRVIFRQIGLEQLAERTGIRNAMNGLGIKASIAEIVAHIVFFFLLLSFATSAVTLMGLITVADLLQDVLRFVPRAISAAILVIFGSMLARFLGNTIAAVADNVNITYGRALGKIIEFAIVAFVIVLAISTLGVDTTILTSSLTIIVASAGLAIALTFAFGAREAARNIIAGFYVRQNFQPGQRLTFGEYSGTVRSTSGAYTVLDAAREEGQGNSISLPNAMLLQAVVTGREGGSNSEVPGAENNQPGDSGREQKE